VPDAIQQRLQRALVFHQQGKLSEAKKLYEDILEQRQNHFDALHFLGVIAYQTNHLEQAERLISGAIKISPDVADAYTNRGLILKDLKRLDEALACYEKAIALKPDSAAAYNNRGIALNELTRPNEALVSYDKAIALKPDYAEAYNNRGIALNNLKRPDEALASFDKALSLKPDLPEAWLGRGNALKDLNRPEEALAGYDMVITLKPDYAEAYNNRGIALNNLKRLSEALASFDKVLSLKSDLPEAWLGRGNALKELNRLEEALANYDKAIALRPDYAEVYNNRGIALNNLKLHDESLANFDKALELESDHAETYNDRGIALKNLRRLDEAIASYDRAIALKPDYAEAYYNRGNALNDLKRPNEVLASFDKAISLKPDLPEAWLGRGNALKDLKRLDEALVSYDKALSLQPDLIGTEGARLHAKMQLCDWTDFESECAHLTSSIKAKKANTAPFYFLGISSSPHDQIRCAKLWTKEKCSLQQAMWQGERCRHERIRLAYVSADFRQHAASFLTAGMFECHDKSRFEVTAISYGADDKSEMRQRIKSSFERFVDVRTYSDERIGNLVRAFEIDIAVDLMGFTTESRTGIFARRPAPIQVNYLGFAGTMGAPFIDYIIADRYVIPREKQECYCEKIVHLPDSFMATDSKRKMSDRIPLRSECNLPEAGFVFCSFNNSYKIVPQIFDIWMSLLRQFDGSVLWLSNTNETAIRNLRCEAQNRGVDASRLVFARREPLNEDHLARHQLADLFLDTLPYNAHTTASDALWAGLPVVTCLGDTFAGRVAASLLNAIELPELIAPTLERYEEIAIDLATHPEKLAVIKRKLAKNRVTTPLFDTKGFTKNIEAAYTAMYERDRAGLSPDHIIVR
jgi:protein O-GlcNAc transferase